MYRVNKKYRYGYVMLPCFKVKMLEGTEGVDLECGSILEWIFEHFFAPFWSGKVHLYKTIDELIAEAPEGDLFPDLPEEIKARNRAEVAAEIAERDKYKAPKEDNK